MQHTSFAQPAACFMSDLALPFSVVRAPEHAVQTHTRDPQRLLLWHCNYHPDGGQMFFPNEPGPFLAPLALPGDDVRPQDFVCLWFRSGHGLCMHPNVWHEGVFATRGSRSFYDE